MWNRFHYFEKTLQYVGAQKKIYHINCLVDQLMGYGMKYAEELESYLAVLESMVDPLLEQRPDKDNCLCHLHLGIVKIALACKREDKQAVNTLGAKIIKLIDISNMEKY